MTTTASNVEFEKRGEWTSFGGPSYDVAVGGKRLGAILGGYCWRGGSLRSQGTKTKAYTVYLYGEKGGREVGHTYSFKEAQEIARRAVASIGYLAARQADGTLAVFDASGVKQFESGSFYSIVRKFPAVILANA